MKESIVVKNCKPVNNPQHRGRRLQEIKNERGAIDLASVMVGVIVIGLVAAVIAATVFLIIPWTQDNAAKHQLESIVAAESAYMGLSSSGTYSLPSGAVANSFGNSAELEMASLLKTGPNYCVAILADGKSYIAFSQSLTGKIWSSGDKNTKPVIFSGVIPSECEFITEYGSAPYVDPAPTVTSFTYRCDTTRSGTLPIYSKVTGTEEWNDSAPKTYAGVTYPSVKTLTAGVTYTVKFTGTYEKFKSNVTFNTTMLSSCLREVNHWGSETGVIEAHEAFYSATNLTDVPKHIPSTITNMTSIFYGAKNFNDPDINQWDMSKVTTLESMFSGASVFNQPLDKWDTSNVTNLTNLFDAASAFNQDLNNWDTSNVTNMSGMFSNASVFNQPLDKWNTSKVADFNKMFYYAKKFDQNLNNWNVGQATNLSQMFNSASVFNQPLDKWNTSNVTDMSGMFSNTPVFNQPIGNWDTSKVTNIASMFSSAYRFNQPLNDWDTSNVTSMSSVFSIAFRFNQPIDKWNTSNVTNMNGMFNNATYFNQPIGNWDVSNVTSMHQTFANNKGFNQPLNNWDTSNVTTMSSMFNGATTFNQPLNNWKTSNVTIMSAMFNNAPAFSQDISNWDTAALTSGASFALATFPTSYLPVGTTKAP